MVQNDNHETGGVFVDLDVVTEQCANVKTVCIQGSAPSNKYDGEIWVDTSEDPPTIKVYDDTNTAWMTRRFTSYEEIAMGGLIDHPTQQPAVNGMIMVVRDTTDSIDYLCVRSDNSWYGATTA